LILDLIHKGSIDLIRDVFDTTVCETRFKIAVLYICKDVQFFNLSQNFGGSFGRDLAAICTINLVAIVFAGIVRSSDHHASRGVQITGCKGHSRHRHQHRPNINLDTICSENASGYFCKYITLDAAVITDYHRRLCKVFLQIVSQTLRCLCYGVNIHAVGSSTDYTAKTTSAKCKVTVECIFNFCIVQCFQLSGNIGICRCICKPTLVFFLDIHLLFPHLSLNLSEKYLWCKPYPSHHLGTCHTCLR